jgi:hypothetical protein
MALVRGKKSVAGIRAVALAGGETATEGDRPKGSECEAEGLAVGDREPVAVGESVTATDSESVGKGIGEPLTVGTAACACDRGGVCVRRTNGHTPVPHALRVYAAVIAFVWHPTTFTARAFVGPESSNQHSVYRS